MLKNEKEQADYQTKNLFGLNSKAYILFKNIINFAVNIYNRPDKDI